MSTIHVYSSLSGDYIKVPAVDSTGYTSNLSLWKHRLIRKLARDNQERPDIYALGETKRKIRAISENARTQIKLSKKQRARWNNTTGSMLDKSLNNGDGLGGNNGTNESGISTNQEANLSDDAHLSDDLTGWDMDFSSKG